MKTLTNANARTLPDAVALVQQAHRDGRQASFSGGGSDLLGLVKERIITPDVVVNLKTIGGQDQIAPVGRGARIGGLVTLDALSHNALVRRQFTVLADAAEGVATPQIRNVGTLAGNLCQRPWCWYYRNGFPCYKAGGNRCFSFAGENQFHAIFGGGPSYIVHPSDTAPALVALDAVFHLVGPAGRREMPASEFFVLPRRDPARENVLGDEDLLAAVEIPAPPVPPVVRRSAYHKVMDREAWTHAIVSAAVVLEMDGAVNRRDLLLLRTDRDTRVVELSCERLYMQYQHTRLTMDRPVQPPAPDPGELWDHEQPAVFDIRTTQELFGAVDRELRTADVVRVVDTGWLAVDAFRRDVEDLLAAFRRRGGRVEYQGVVPSHAAPSSHC